MTAKISDLGVARILNLTPLQVTHMTQTPGTPAYMPPEVMEANPKYDTSVDVFSYGAMMIHVFSGQWPEPQTGPVRTEPNGNMIPISEAERREVLLEAIGNDHPLMEFILKCIYNHPRSRAHAREIVERLGIMMLQFSSSMTNRLDGALSKIKDVEGENKHLRKETSTLEEKIEKMIGKFHELQTENKQLKTENLAAKVNLLDPSQALIHASITWKTCAELPTRVNGEKSTVIEGKVYCGGGVTDPGDTDYVVYCYDPSQDKWTTLPPLPVRYFGLGQANGKIVAVGGEKREDKSKTNRLHTYDEKSRKWKQTIPPMPTVRWSPDVVSLQSALVVVGGCTTSPPYTAAVEIFQLHTSQWYRTIALPIALCSMPLVAIGNTCYALGGYNGSRLNQTLYAVMDDLLGNAVPASKTGSSDTQSSWKILPNTPTYGPTAAVLAGKVLAVGGKETAEKGATRKEIYMFSHSTNSWVYIGDLPAPLCLTSVAILSQTEILVIGGWNGSSRVNTVSKGTLHLKP